MQRVRGDTWPLFRIFYERIRTLSLPGRAKIWLNTGLKPFNVRIESLAFETAELVRLRKLENEGHFDRSILPVLEQFQRCDPMAVLKVVQRFGDQTARFDGVEGEGAYSFRNDYFTSPDAEVAYALVRHLRPAHLVEVGSGNSTLLFREAIKDGGLATELISIDPFPRVAIEGVADHVMAQRLEDIPANYLCDTLGPNDILFIDSSHEVKLGNDVVNLLLKVVPILENGVVVHLHDIFLPYEYPRAWIIEKRWKWNEQYLVQALLQGSRQLEVIWPGHFLQRTLPGFTDYFAARQAGAASSLWLRKIA